MVSPKSSHSNKACVNVRLHEFGKLEGIQDSENFSIVISECRVTPAEQWRVACSISLSGSNLISQLSRLPIKKRIRGGAAEAARWRGQAFGSGSCLVRKPQNCAIAMRECHLLFSSDTAHSVLNLAVKDIFNTTKYWCNAMAQFTGLVI